VWRRYGNYDASTRNHYGRFRYDQHYDGPDPNYNSGSDHNSGIDNNDHKSADNDPAHDHICRHHR
jgi:hypothetical protein